MNMPSTAPEEALEEFEEFQVEAVAGQKYMNR
jgi:hypothetical protein